MKILLSDLYPIIYNFLLSNGFKKIAKQFKKIVKEELINFKEKSDNPVWSITLRGMFKSFLKSNPEFYIT